MILQRGVELPIWGWASPGEKVTVTIAKNTVTTTADAKGRWKTALPAIAAGKKLTMTVKGKNTIQLKNIAMGEVWLCSGQSNMEWSMAATTNAAKAIAAARHPDIRLFQVAHRPNGQKQTDVMVRLGGWRSCRPRGARSFSAVAYYYGRKLHQELKVPIGLIQSAWGGTRIEPWTPPVGFMGEPSLKGVLKNLSRFNKTYRISVAEYIAGALPIWTKEAGRALDEGSPIPPMPAQPRHPLYRGGHPTSPTILYNGMIHPIVPFAIRGAIWYQGESNMGEGMLYRDKMRALINGWRRIWGNKEMPFYFVQLAPFSGYRPGQLPLLWEAQTATLKVPHTGMAVITDLVGNIRDIHPRNKKDVGERLARWALAKTYEKKGVVYSGPAYQSHKVVGKAIQLAFKHAESGLKSRDDKALTWFEIAGKDGKFVKAKAEIDGNKVIVKSDEVTAPIAVRFAWNKLAMPNLANQAGLPALPFRTKK